MAITEGTVRFSRVRFSNSVFRKGNFHLELELKPGFMPCIFTINREHNEGCCELLGLGGEFLKGEAEGQVVDSHELGFGAKPVDLLLASHFDGAKDGGL